MIQAKLSQAAKWVDAELIGHDTEFKGIAIDSRIVEPGSMFVAIRGKRLDGHDYIEYAKARGASCALVRSPVTTSLPLLVVKDSVEGLGKLAEFWRRRHELPVIGVLGSNGKSTVKEIIAAILQSHYGDNVLATRGNQNNELGIPLNLLRLDSSHQVAILEMGANGHGEITRLGRIVKPDIAVITNAGLDHIAGFGGLEGAAKANGEIFAAMNDNGIAIVNGDDPCLRIWRGQINNRPYLQFGLNPGVDVRGHWHSTNYGGALRIVSPWGQIHCRLNLMGRHNALNALAAAATCMTLDVGLDTIADGLASIDPINGRLKPKLSSGGALVIDDTYNANPSSLMAALETISSLPGKKILVLGDMAELGDEAESWHREAGHAARSAGVELLFTVGDLARFAADSFGQGACHFSSSQALLNGLLPQLETGYNVLIKGSRCMALERVVIKLMDNSN